MTTNRAFIKAYRHDAAQPALAIPAIADSARAASDSTGASIAYVSPGGSEIADFGRKLSGALSFTASIDVVGPGAELAVDTVTRLPIRESSAKPPASARRIGSKPWRSDASTAAKRPLSAFIPRQPAAPVPFGSIKTTDLRPGTTVASFQWPAVCRVLCRKFATEMDHVCDLLQQRAAQARERRKPIIGVMGLFPGCGCTSIALLAAMKLAGRGQKAIVADGNLCKPRIAQWLNVVPTSGWQDVLRSESPLADALIRSTGDHLDLLALAARTSGDALKIVAHSQTTTCADQLRTAYDIVLVDLGAFFNARSQPVALELVHRMQIDAALAVAGPGEPDPRDLASVVEHLQRSKCELLGTIHNRAAATKIEPA